MSPGRTAQSRIFLSESDFLGMQRGLVYVIPHDDLSRRPPEREGFGDPVARRNIY
jgi:hypothetical protein